MKKIKYMVPVALVCAYPVLFMYLNNIGNVRFEETILPMMIFLAFGGVMTLLFMFLTRSFIKGCVCSTIVSFFFTNFTIFEKIMRHVIPSMKYWHFLPCVFFVIGFFLWTLCRKSEEQTYSRVLLVCSIVMGGLIAVNIMTAIPKLINNLGQSENKSSELPIVSEHEIEEKKPNIYYFIFDEYSSFDVLEKYFDYDNKPFAEFLENRGFTVSFDGRNDSQQTLTIMSNYINLDYIAFDTDSNNRRGDLVKSKVLFEMAESYGYNINSLMGGDFLGLDESVVRSTSISGEDFTTLILNHTACYPFLEKNTNTDATMYNNAFRVFENEDFYRAIPHSTFNVLYFNLPHQPFIFDADGNSTPTGHINDWVNKEYYLNQLIYTTKCIEKTVDNILKNDADSIIILQSDHSARSLKDADGNYIIDKYDRRCFLNAVYYLGEDFEEIKGTSGVNTLRLICNRLFGLELPQLEVPNSEFEF